MESIILVRVKNGIGIDQHANAYTLDGKPIKKRFYNGRLCYQHNGTRLGYKTLAQTKPVCIKLDFSLPF